MADTFKRFQSGAAIIHGELRNLFAGGIRPPRCNPACEQYTCAAGNSTPSCNPQPHTLCRWCQSSECGQIYVGGAIERLMRVASGVISLGIVLSQIPMVFIPQLRQIISEKSRSQQASLTPRPRSVTPSRAGRFGQGLPI